MYRIIQILSFCLFFNCCSSAQNKTIYLLFDDNKPVKCNISPYRDGRNKKEVVTLSKKNIVYEKEIIFRICNQFFVFNPDTDTKKIVHSKPKNIVSIDYLIDILEENYLDSTKEKLFKNIYILEKNNAGNFSKYKVFWKDMYINDN